MRRNHFHSSGNSKRANALKHGYKSGLELSVSMQINQTEYPLNYETETLKYIVPERKAKYTPDFVFTKRNGDIMYVETKGRWMPDDRKKHLLVKEQHPDLDIRIVFQSAKSKLRKGSKTTYADYCDKHGIKWAEKIIPQAWIDEEKKADKKVDLLKKFL
jgi:hypothetical protein